MDAVPTYDFWWRFAAILSAEVAAMAAAAWALEKFSSSGVWRRTVWHVCLIGLVALVAAETSGLGRIVAAQFAAKAPLPEETLQYSETFSLAAEPSSAAEEPIIFLTSPESSAAVVPRQSWWPAILWVAGFAVVSLGAIFLRALFAIASRRRCRPANEDVVERTQQVAALLGLRLPVDVVEIDRINTPIAFGIVKPKIGVPEEFSRKFTEQQQEVMLAHELAHVAGRDAIWHLLVDLVAALLWWHPMVWWARRRLHFATEAAADEASMVVKDGPSVLAETLVTLGGSLLKPQHRGALGIKGLRSGLARRVQKLMALKDGEWRGLSFRNRWVLKICGPLLLAAGAIACFTWTGNSTGTPHDEWQNSLAGRTFAALSAEAANADAERIPGLLGDAKIFFDRGKLDHAEGLCGEVLRIDSENSEALRLIDAISKARKTNLAENVDDKSGARPAEMERVLPPETDPSKNRFMAPQTIGSFEQVISNALNFSTEEKRRRVRFTEGSGVSNIVYNSKGRQRIRRLLEEIRLPSVMYDDVGLGEVLRRLSEEVRQRDPEKRGIDFLLSAEIQLPPIDPATGLPVGRAEPFLELSSRNIRIIPALQNVTLGMALDAICKVAETPIYYSVEEYAVVFVPTERPRSLHTRLYKPDRDTVLKHFGRQWTPDPATLRPPPRERDVGLEFILTLRELLAEAGVDLAPPKAIFFNDRLGKLMVRATLEDHDVIQRAIQRFLPPAKQVLVEVRVAEFRGDAVGIKSALGIDVTGGKVLSDPQYRLAIRALKQAAGVHVLGAQTVTTLDGRQTRFELQGLEKLDLDDAILHVVPHIGRDDRNIYLVTALSKRQPASATVRGGQTALVPLPSVKKVYGEGVSVPVLTRIAFVTVTIIDAAGNRAHAEENEEANPFEGIWRF